MGERQDGSEAAKAARERMVLEGEIVLSDQGGERRRGRGRGYREYDEDLIEEVIRDRLVKGMTLSAIRAKHGVSMETTARWAGERRKEAPKGANVVKIRDRISASLDTVAIEAWQIHEAAKMAKQGQLALAALKQIETVYRTQAVLHGANAPVRHDLTVAVVTEAERELQEMIREAKVREAAREQAVIDAASADADL